MELYGSLGDSLSGNLRGEEVRNIMKNRELAEARRVDKEQHNKSD